MAANDISIKTKLYILFSLFFIISIVNMAAYINFLNKMELYARMLNIAGSERWRVYGIIYMVNLFGGEKKEGDELNSMMDRYELVLNELKAHIRNEGRDNSMLDEINNILLEMSDKWKPFKEGVSGFIESRDQNKGIASKMQAVNLAPKLVSLADRLTGSIEKYTAHSAGLIKRKVIIIFLASIIFALFIIYIFIKNVVKPIDEARSFAERLAAGNLSARLKLRSRDEIGVLVNTLDDMAEKLDGIYKDMEEKIRIRTEQLVRAEKLSALGTLVAGIAHEINNPLTGILGYSQLLLSKELDEDTRKKIMKINNEGQRTAKIVKNLVVFARQDRYEKEDIDINKVVERVMEAKTHDFASNNIEVVKRLQLKLPLISGNALQLQYAFLAIISNAIKSMEGVLEKKIFSVGTEAGGKDVIKLSFSDTGCGIPKDILDKVFDPFFTTRTVGKGVGLGLSAVYGIVKEHGGNVSIDSEEGKGTTVFVELPVVGLPVKNK